MVHNGRQCEFTGCLPFNVLSAWKVSLWIRASSYLSTVKTPFFVLLVCVGEPVWEPDHSTLQGLVTVVDDRNIALRFLVYRGWAASVRCSSRSGSGREYLTMSSYPDLHTLQRRYSKMPPHGHGNCHAYPRHNTRKWKKRREDRLVTPSALHKNFPEAVRKELMTLGTFMETVKILLHNY